MQPGVGGTNSLLKWIGKTSLKEERGRSSWCRWNGFSGQGKLIQGGGIKNIWVRWSEKAFNILILEYEFQGDVSGWVKR